DSEEVNRVWTPEEYSSSSNPTNFYGSDVSSRFPFDCTTTLPTPRTLDANAPNYVEDSYNPSPGSGFLQFWTVSLMLKLDKPTVEMGPDPTDLRHMARTSPFGVFGRNGRELGIVYVDTDWATVNVPKQ